MLTWASVQFLFGYYWPYLAAAAAIGLVVGWRSFTPPKP
jgi:hypothetical protein